MKGAIDKFGKLSRNDSITMRGNVLRNVAKKDLRTKLPERMLFATAAFCSGPHGAWGFSSRMGDHLFSSVPDSVSLPFARSRFVPPPQPHGTP